VYVTFRTLYLICNLNACHNSSVSSWSQCLYIDQFQAQDQCIANIMICSRWSMKSANNRRARMNERYWDWDWDWGWTHFILVANQWRLVPLGPFLSRILMKAQHFWSRDESRHTDDWCGPKQHTRLADAAWNRSVTDAVVVVAMNDVSFRPTRVWLTRSFLFSCHHSPVLPKITLRIMTNADESNYTGCFRVACNWQRGLMGK